MLKRAILAMVVSLVALVAVGATLVACTAQTVQHAATPTLAPSPTPLPTWPTAPTSRLKGMVTEFRIPTKGANPNYIVAGPDGNVWFTEAHANKIGRSTPQGSITEFAVPTANAGLTAIAAGPDGNLWFTERTADKIGRSTPQGTITEFAIPTAAAQPLYLTAGPDGNLWFTEAAGNKIGKITPQGTISEFAVPTANAGLSGITAGVDGNVWFVEYNTTIIGRITAQGTITEYDAQFHVPNPPGGTTFPSALPNQPLLLARAADGVWWNFGHNGIGYMQPDGKEWVFYGAEWGPGNQSPTPPPACFAVSGNMWAAPDGALWGWSGCLVVRLVVTYSAYSVYGNPSFQLFTVPAALDGNSGLVFAPLADGTVWFVGQSTDQIGRLT